MTADEPSTVSYFATLPLFWQASSAQDKANEAYWHHANLALLRALASIESVLSSEGEYERDTHQSKILERLEAKIDIAISLLARLNHAQSELPQQLPVTLSAQHLEWIDSAPPTADLEVTLTVYLSPKLPEPLMLRAKILSVSMDNEGTRCLAEFLDRDEEFLDWMTRTVFRYHRRALQARHQP